MHLSTMQHDFVHYYRGSNGSLMQSCTVAAQHDTSALHTCTYIRLLHNRATTTTVTADWNFPKGDQDADMTKLQTDRQTDGQTVPDLGGALP